MERTNLQEDAAKTIDEVRLIYWKSRIAEQHKASLRNCF